MLGMLCVSCVALLYCAVACVECGVLCVLCSGHAVMLCMHHALSCIVLCVTSVLVVLYVAQDVCALLCCAVLSVCVPCPGACPLPGNETGGVGWAGMGRSCPARRRAPAVRAAAAMEGAGQYMLPGQGAQARGYEYLKEDAEQGLALGPPVQPSYGLLPPPRDHLVWSIFNTLYMNFCCLGFFALAFSVKARDRKVLGDYSGAGSYGSTAKCLNITALILSLLFFILIIILVATGVIVLANLSQPGV